MPDAIVIHHSAGPDNKTLSWPATRRYHKSYRYQGNIIQKDMALGMIAKNVPVIRPWRDIGYHFGIEQFDGHYETLCGRMLTKTGAHCREYEMNRRSIGICLVGNFDETPPPPEQWNCAVSLVKSMMRIFKIPPVMVYGHRELTPYKTCPGHLFDMERFRREIA